MGNHGRMLAESKNKQIVQFCFKKLEEMLRNDDFLPDLLVIMTLPWQRQISWTLGRYIKISERDE